MKSNQFNPYFTLSFVTNKSHNLITNIRKTKFENEM